MGEKSRGFLLTVTVVAMLSMALYSVPITEANHPDERIEPLEQVCILISGSSGGCFVCDTVETAPNVERFVCYTSH